VLDLVHRVPYEWPPRGGVDASTCETHACYLVCPVLLMGERGVEIALPSGDWFFEDPADAWADARRWLKSVERIPGATGAHAHVRAAEVLVDPMTGQPTRQLAGNVPIIGTLESGAALDYPWGA
jgi:hypothetical protein